MFPLFSFFIHFFRGSADPICPYVWTPMGHRLMTVILSNLERLEKFFTGRFFSKFVVTTVT